MAAFISAAAFLTALPAAAMQRRETLVLSAHPTLTIGLPFYGYEDREPLMMNKVSNGHLVEAQAEAGDAIAEFQMGTVTGFNAESKARALYWTERSARQGYVPAIYNLGIYKSDFMFGSTDDAEAAEHFETAAKLGFPPAMRELARVYFCGVGRQKNEAEGRKWLRLASDNGEPKAIAFLAEEASQREYAKRSHDESIRRPRKEWAGKIVGVASTRQIDATLFASSCPVSKGWRYGVIKSRYGNALIPVTGGGAMVSIPMAGCWKPDPGSADRVDVCPFDYKGALKACEYPASNLALRPQ